MDLQTIATEIISTGLTQQQLADLIPCHQTTINAILKGRRGLKNPSARISDRLREIYAARCAPDTSDLNAPMPTRESDISAPPDPSPTRKNVMELTTTTPPIYEKKEAP